MIIADLASIDTLAARRDNALLQVGYFGGFRRSKLVKLGVKDLAEGAESAVLTPARSKTDRDGQGIVKAIARI